MRKLLISQRLYSLTILFLYFAVFSHIFAIYLSIFITTLASLSAISRLYYTKKSATSPPLEKYTFTGWISLVFAWAILYHGNVSGGREIIFALFLIPPHIIFTFLAGLTANDHKNDPPPPIT